MKIVLGAVPLIVGLSLCSLSCQKAVQSNNSPAGTNAGNASTASSAGAESKPPAAPQTQLKVGDTAPDFTLTNTEGQQV